MGTSYRLTIAFVGVTLTSLAMAVPVTEQAAQLDLTSEALVLTSGQFACPVGMVTSSLRLSEPVAFAGGSETGSVVGSLWTPAYTGGVVNQASWDIVPTGEWIEVSGSRIDTLTAEIEALGTGWSASSLAWSGVMNAWNGVAIDQDGSRVWLLAAGGHADSSNNGVYRFDCFKMKWAVEKAPSDRNAWSAQYKNLSAPQPGTFTNCYESDTASPQASASEVAATAATRKYYFDQLFWTVEPTSRHVYSAPIYKASTNELVMGCRSLWSYSITSGAWTYNRLWDIAMDGSELMGAYDEATDEYLQSGMGDGFRGARGYNLTSNTFTDWSCPWLGFQWEGVADTRHGRDITVWSPPFSDRTYTKYAVYNLDSRSFTEGNVAPTYAGGLSAASFKATSSGASGMGMVYVPPLDEYWILYNLQAGMTWLKLDPTTTPWTISPKTFTGTLPEIYDKPCRKIVWMPDLNAVMLWSRDDRGAYVYKL